MTILARLLTCFAAVVSSAPVTIESILQRRESPEYGEPLAYRTSFVITSKFCTFVLAGLLGYRICVLNKQPANRMTFTQIYIFALYILSIGFVTSASVVNNGLGLTTDSSCKASVMICILFYAGSKVAMYLFLVERAHILRAPYASRSKDKFWLFSTLGIVGSLGAICVIGLVSPVYYLSDRDGRCRIGLQRYAGIPLLIVDIIINIYLTLVFVYLLSPLLSGSQPSGTSLSNRVTRGISNMCDRAKQKATVDLHRSNKVVAKKVERLLWRTFIGCLLVIFPTAGNLTAVVILVGKELAFVCLTLCTLDVTWAACIFHWLTIAGADDNEGSPLVTQARKSSYQQPARPIHAHSEPPGRKSTMISRGDFDLLASDAESGVEADSVSKSGLGLDLDLTATKSKDGANSPAATDWRDSGHSTLVSDINMSTTAEPQ